MKIISVDNFNREGPGHDDHLIATTGSDRDGRFWAKEIVDRLNKDLTENSHIFFRAVEDDYKLKVFEP